MQFRIARRIDHVALELTGPIDLPVLLGLIEKLGDLTQSEGDSRLMFNMLGMTGEVPLTAQIEVGEHVVRHLSHLMRVASVVPAERVTRTSEKIARAQGLEFKVFDDLPQAQAWLQGSAAPAEPSEATDAATIDPPRAAIWAAFRHLFPAHAKAIQLPSGMLAISWSIANHPDATFEMATPITVRLEPELLERMRTATAEQRSRIAAHQEAAFRAGLVGYDPYTSVPRSRVIVLG
jgi:hypothetical protein